MKIQTSDWDHPRCPNPICSCFYTNTPLTNKLIVRLMLCAYFFTIQYIKTKNCASSRLLLKNSVSQKNSASSRLLAQNRVSQVFWELIKNPVSPRSVLLKAVYLEALLYFYFSMTTLVTNLSFLAHLIGTQSCIQYQIRQFHLTTGLFLNQLTKFNTYCNQIKTIETIFVSF